jgi:glycerol uptake facilitator-like aquaporin
VRGTRLGRSLCEAGGTALLVGLGTGAVVWAARSGGIAQWEMAAAWFFAVLIPILLFVQLSGAHLNPAITLSLAASGRVSWDEVPAYILGQLAGAFGASLVVRVAVGNYARLGATVPSGVSTTQAFALEFLFTALLVGAVFHLADRGEGVRRWRLMLPPTVVGVSTFLIGPFTGSSLNPARTIAPAVLSATYTDLWVYLLAVPLAAVAVAAVWKPAAVDRLDRGPGRLDVST